MGDKAHKKSDINYYLTKVSKGYEIMGIIKAISLSFFVLFAIVTVIRKHRLTFYQWLQLFLIIALDAIDVTFMIGFDTSMTEDKCGYKQKMYYGTIYCLFYVVCVLLAYKFQYFFRQISNFVKDGTLPTEKTIKRNYWIMMFICLFALCDWAVYVAINTHYVHKG